MDTYSYLLTIALICCIGSPGWADTGSGKEVQWTNENGDPVLSGPDHPTTLSFNECVKIVTITTYHWNYGKGDQPGSISLFHEDGTTYGPWGTIGGTGSDGVKNTYWISSPGEVLKPGTYIITDSKPDTWSKNDASDNQGIVNITYEPVSCSENTTGITPKKSVNLSTPIPDSVKNGIQITPGEIDPRSLSGEETDTLHVPDIRQVSFVPLSQAVTGGSKVYAMLTVKNIGDRDLKDGYISVRFISKGNTFSYRGGMAKIPPVAAGEEREIPLIIPSEAPKLNDKGTEFVNEPVACLPYRLEGKIDELMNGGYFVTRGTLSTAGDNMVEFTGCCQEPSTTNTIRGCEPIPDQ